MTNPQQKRRKAHEEYEEAWEEEADREAAAMIRNMRVKAYWFVAGVTIVVIGAASMIYGVGRGFGWWN